VSEDLRLDFSQEAGYNDVWPAASPFSNLKCTSPRAGAFIGSTHRPKIFSRLGGFIGAAALSARVASEAHASISEPVKTARASAGGTPEAAGAALYCFGLIPDLGAFREPEIEKRLSRNWNAVKILDDAGTPLSTRINKLRLEPNTCSSGTFRSRWLSVTT